MRHLFLYIMLFTTFIGAPTFADAQEYSVDDLEILADGGNHEAQYRLATLYLTGNGVEKDITHALNLFIESATHGYDKAQHVLGKLYRDGIYLKRNEKDAIEWFSKAAGKGNIHAQYDLAVMFARYRNSKQSMIKAYAWFEVLARRKHPKAVSGRKEVAKGMRKHQIIAARHLANEYYDEYVVRYEESENNDDESTEENTQK